jgi:hypothetical protein
LHQIAGNFESRASRLKSVTNRAFAQAEMEAISHNNAVWQCVKQSQQQSKRKMYEMKPSFKKENLNYKKQSTVKSG